MHNKLATFLWNTKRTILVLGWLHLLHDVIRIYRNVEEDISCSWCFGIHSRGNSCWFHRRRDLPGMLILCTQILVWSMAYTNTVQYPANRKSSWTFSGNLESIHFTNGDSWHWTFHLLGVNNRGNMMIFYFIFCYKSQ